MPDGKDAMMAAPYLSLVVTARNDDHGGNLLGRMQAFVNNWLNQARRFGIPSELIIVEWNPPQDRPRLPEVLRWPDAPGPCAVRIIEVPPEIHARLGHAAALPLYQMIAKNVGIRRARGQFVLATNIDIIFSSELAAFLAEQRLDPDRMYRIDRHDAGSDVPVDADPETQLEYCRTHVIRINRRGATFGPDQVPGAVEKGEAELQESAAVVEETPEAVEETTEAVEESAEAVEETAEAVEETAEAVEETPEAVEETTEAVEETAEAVEEIAEAVEEAEEAPKKDADVRKGTPLEAPGVALGEGWYPEECYGSRKPFRWAGERAQMVIDGPPSPSHTLVLEVEPGPGIDEDAEFEIVGPGGFAAPIQLPRRSRVFLRADWHTVNRLEFRAKKPVNGSARDARPLALRVIRMQWNQYAVGGPATGSADVRGLPLMRRVAIIYEGVSHLLRKLAYEGPLARITSAAAVERTAEAPKKDPDVRQGTPLKPPGVALGEGWYPEERYGSREPFRWAGERAQMVIDGPPSPSHTLVLEVEPGPGIDEDAEFEIVGPGGFAAPIQLPRRSRVFLRADWDTVNRLEFRAKKPVTASARDARPLALRVIRIQWNQYAAGGPATGSADVRGLPLMRRVAIIYEGVCHLLRKLAYEGPLVRVTVLVSPSFQKLLRGWVAPPEGRTVVEAVQEAEQRRATTVYPELLHTNGCGDFTLLAREKWFDLRAYPEFDLFSMNLDSVFCFAAHYGGAREIMLEDPMRIYHIEHGTGSGWTPEGQAKLFQRIEALGLSYLDNDTVMGWAQQMRRFNSPMIFNRDNWGFPEDELPETVPVVGK